MKNYLGIKKHHYIIFLLLLLTALSSVLLSSCKFSGVKNENKNIEMENETVTNYVRVIDLYDATEDKPFSAFLQEQDALKRLKNMNKELNGAFDFYEFQHQPLEIYEYCKIDPKFAKGYESGDYVYNLQVKDQSYITKLKSMQIGEYAFKEWKLSEKIESGNAFEEKDYNYGSNYQIPVLLGAEYKDSHAIGDTIKANYLGTDFSFDIIGFFAKGTVVELNEITEQLDRYIVIPYFDIEGEEELTFQKRYYAQKNWGYIPYETKENVQLIEKTVNGLAEKNNMLYSIVQNNPELE